MAYFGTLGPDSVSGAYEFMFGDDGDDQLTSSFDDSAYKVVLIGGDGNDFLNYLDSGSCTTYIFGENGNDTIDAGNRSDQLFGGDGNDIISGARASLFGADEIYGGRGNDRLYGYWSGGDDAQDGFDYIFGGPGNDKLFGQNGDDDLHGGTGNDQLKGGDGEDEFKFDTKLNARTNVDRVRDFSPVDDVFNLSPAIFTKLGGTGQLAEGRFHVGAKAADGSDRIIYHRSTGELLYDRDGKGGAGQVLFATVDGNPDLTYLDFYVV